VVHAIIAIVDVVNGQLGFAQNRVRPTVPHESTAVSLLGQCDTCILAATFRHRLAEPYAEGIDLGRRKRLAPLAEVCGSLFGNPTIGGFLTAFREAVASRKELG
jgi:hypothetical protein